MAMQIGGCHCGRVRFEVDGSPAAVVECNCSVCARKGYLHWIVPRAAFRLVAGAADLSTYRFGTRVAQHHFCRHCGVGSFYVPRSHPDGIDVNARCLDGVDVASLPRSSFDGQHWEEAVERLRGRLREEEGST
jgi:centromere protein V